jgi:hypothetical protein
VTDDEAVIDLVLENARYYHLFLQVQQILTVKPLEFAGKISARTKTLEKRKHHAKKVIYAHNRAIEAVA